MLLNNDLAKIKKFPSVLTPVNRGPTVVSKEQTTWFMWCVLKNFEI